MRGAVTVMVALLVVLALFGAVSGTKVSGKVRNGQERVELGDFVYAKGVSKLDFKISHMGKELTALAYLGLFDDQSGSWDDAVSEPNCNNIRQHARGVLEMSGGLERKDFHVVDHLFPRRWYVMMVACGLPKGVEMTFDYELEFTNEGGFFMKQFPAPLQNMTVLYIILSVLLLPLVLLTVVSVLASVALRALRLTQGLYALALLSFFGMSFCLMIEGIVYGANGEGVAELRTLSQLLFFSCDALLGMLFLYSASVNRPWSGTLSRTLRTLPLIRRSGDQVESDNVPVVGAPSGAGSDGETQTNGGFDSVDLAATATATHTSTTTASAVGEGAAGRAGSKVYLLVLFGVLVSYVMASLLLFILMNVSLSYGTAYYIFDTAGGQLYLIVRAGFFLVVLGLALYSAAMVVQRLQRVPVSKPSGTAGLTGREIVLERGLRNPGAADLYELVFVLALPIVGLFWFLSLPIIIAQGNFWAFYDRVYATLIPYCVLQLLFLVALKFATIPYDRLIVNIRRVAQGENIWRRGAFDYHNEDEVARHSSEARPIHESATRYTQEDRPQYAYGEGDDL